MRREFDGAIFEGLLLGGPAIGRGSAFGTAFDWRGGFFIEVGADPSPAIGDQSIPSP